MCRRLPLHHKSDQLRSAGIPGLRSFHLQDLEEEIRIPARRLSAGFDASLGFVGADEAEREATDDGHVLGAVAGAVARQVVRELDVEHPVHALDAPMAARTGGEPFDVERSAGDVEPGVESASVRVFGSIDDAKDRLDAFEARPTRIGSLALEPIDDLRGGIEAGFDAAVAFLDLVLETISSAGTVAK